MSRIQIRFGGAWRLMLSAQSEEVDVAGLDELKTYIETKFGPMCRQRLQAREISKAFSIWDNSSILINGRAIRQSDTLLLKDGDILDFLPRAAGG